MSLQVWLPLTEDTRNQGLSGVTPTINGTVSLDTSGKLGKSYKFGTANGRITFPVSAMTSFTNTCSIAFWIKINTWNKDYATVFQCGLGTTSWTAYRFGVLRNNNNKLHLAISDGTNSYYSLATDDLTLGQWYHICFIYDVGKCRCYVNGSLLREATTTVVPGFSSATVATIGAINASGGYQCDMWLNDFRIYNNALSESEIKELARGLVLHYPLNNRGFGQENLASQYVMPGGNSPGATTTSGRTNYYGAYGITIPATENADTYFSIWYPEPLESEATYTLSAEVSGLLSGSYYNFPLFAQNNTSMGSIKFDHNGLNTFTFTMNYTGSITTTTYNGKTYYRMFMDDNGRAIASGQGAITIKNIKLEKGSVATPWCPNSSDTLYTILGLNSTTEYDISGFQNNGTKTGTFTYTSNTPKYDVSTYMPAAATISHPRCLDNTSQEWTCMAWVKPDAAGNFQNLNNFNEANRLYHGTYPLLYLNSGTNNYYNYGNLALPANQWSHIAFVFKNSTGTKLVYVNGQNRTNTSGPNKTSTPKGIPDTVTIGGSYAGYMCDYREYATALSAEDIAQLYSENKLT